MKIKTAPLVSALALLALSTLNPQLSTCHAQGTAFTYQGRLNASGSPATGNYDFRFRLDADPLGSTILATAFTNAVPVTNGLFITTIDFGAGWFNGSNYWLEVDVRTNATATYVGLTPLQPLLPTPYAIMAGSASNLLGALPAAQLSGTLQNSSLPASPNFSGTVTANAFSGSGTGLTGLNPANLSAGTAGININGNAVTATTATSANSATTAGSATTAATANNFSGALAGDVTGTQGATVVSAVGGVAAANVASGVNAANAATSANTANAIVKRDGSGNFSAGTVTAGGFTGNGANVTGVNAASLNGLGAANFWQTGGNTGANPTNGAYLGTADNYPLEFHVNGVRALRLEPTADFDQVNVIGGSSYNTVSAGVYGATIGGGGGNNGSLNQVTGILGTVSGGLGNTADYEATVGGGNNNTASGSLATVGGGDNNTASGSWATVGGGNNNTASGRLATVAGGLANTASGQWSFAAGNDAQAVNQGAFVWADSQFAFFLPPTTIRSMCGRRAARGL